VLDRDGHRRELKLDGCTTVATTYHTVPLSLRAGNFWPTVEEWWELAAWALPRPRRRHHRRWSGKVLWQESNLQPAAHEMTAHHLLGPVQEGLGSSGWKAFRTVRCGWVQSGLVE
jgi:hypothetical protein